MPVIYLPQKVDDEEWEKRKEGSYVFWAQRELDETDVACDKRKAENAWTE